MTAERQAFARIETDPEPDVLFVIGAQRSGTTVFRKLLERHGALDAGEIFLLDVRGDFNFYRFIRQQLDARPELVHPLRHARAFPDFVSWVRGRAGGRPIVMDVKYNALGLVPNQSGSPFVPVYARETGAGVIQIVRRNKLRAAVSLRLAEKTNTWSVKAEEADKANQPKPRIWLNPRQLLADIAHREAEDASVRSDLHGIRVVEEVHYEDMFEEDGKFSATVSQIAGERLSREDIDRTPAHAKSTVQPLSEIIENFDQVERALNASSFAWMLDDA